MQKHGSWQEPCFLYLSGDCLHLFVLKIRLFIFHKFSPYTYTGDITVRKETCLQHVYFYFLIVEEKETVYASRFFFFLV